MKKIIILMILFSTLTLLINCGDVSVNLDDSTYEKKIVVDGCIYPHKLVENIRITRNYPLNTTVQVDKIVLDDANVRLLDVNGNKAYQLTYNPDFLAFEYTGGDLDIEYGRSYTLSVDAVIDGEALSTSSTTKVPQQGFAIDFDASLVEPLRYRERDVNDELKKFMVAFRQSPDIDSYVASIVALDGSMDTFIEDNLFGVEKEDLEEDNLLDELKYAAQWQQTQLGREGLYEMEVEWWTIWFYGKHRFIMYAADKNLADYFLTHKFIQDIDGNLWEPEFHFEGDGIGVFGSAITDTVYFEVLPD